MLNVSRLPVSGYVVSCAIFIQFVAALNFARYMIAEDLRSNSRVCITNKFGLLYFVFWQAVATIRSIKN